MALKKIMTSEKIKNFFMLNWWFTGVSSIVLIILAIVLFFKLNSIEESFTKKLNMTMQNSIISTIDGRVALLKKQVVNTDSDVFKRYITQLAKLMIASESSLTNGFDSTTAKKITKPSKLLQVNENFKLLIDEFLVNNSVKARFLRFYYNNLKKGELPKKATILSSKNIYKPLEDGGFEIEVTFKVQKDFIDKTDNEDYEVVASDIVTLQGFIKPSEFSTQDNPYGVKFTNIRLNLYLYKNFAKGW